jgi:dipeptidyl aminopeptidase/acylaminoacyl peptidase
MRHLVCAAALALLVPVAPRAQEKTVAVPPTIKVEGMPPIPQSIADDLARYTKFKDAQLIAWHPTKRQLLITTALGDFPQIHLVDGPGKVGPALTSFPQPGIARSVPTSFDPSDPSGFIFQRDPGGTESTSLFRYDLATGAITMAVEARERYTAVWARQGKWLAYDSSERTGKDRELYVVQPSDPTTKRLLGEISGSWSPQDWSPDGSTLLAIELPSNSETYIWRVDVKRGQRTAVTPRDGEKYTWANARFSPDGKYVFALSDRGGDMFRLWRCELATGNWTAVTAPADRVERDGGFEVSSDGRQGAFLIDRDDHSQLQIIDLTTLKARPMTSVPKGVITKMRWRPGSQEVGFTLASPKSPNDVYSVDGATGAVTRWTTSEVGFETEALPVPELMSFKSADGTEITGILYRPLAKFTGPRPVWVTFHGGPDLRERVKFLGRQTYFLNELGVALLFPNVRGSSGRGRSFELLDDGKGRDGVMKDVGAMLDWIATRKDLDKSKVVLTGGSYGGWVALQGGVEYNDRIRGVVEGAGITNFLTYMEETDPARADNRRREFGDERDPAMRQYLTSISPVTRAKDLKKPTFILHPGLDTRVGLGQAQELVKTLQGNNAPVWYFEFTNANHASFPGGNANNDFMIASWVWFLKNFVLN